MAVDLVFSKAPLTAQPLNLVFNDDDAGPSLDRQLQVAGAFPGLSGTVSVRAAVVAQVAGSFPALSGQAIIGGGRTVSVSGAFPSLQGATTVVYNSDTQRPLVSRLDSSFQNGLGVVAGTASRMQDGDRARVPTAGRFQDAQRLTAGTAGTFEDSDHVRVSRTSRYQPALPMRRGLRDGFVQATPTRTAVDDSYQQALKRRNGIEGAYQDTLRLRAAPASRFQQALRFQGGIVLSRVQRGRPIEPGATGRYQEAIRPPGGKWFRPPPVVPPDPCYVPSPDLVFADAWSDDTGLVFVCERHAGPGPDPEPGETVVVPVRRIYAVINTASLRRVDGNVMIPTLGMSLTLDCDSWTWGFTARVPGEALPLLEPGSSGAPVDVEAMINGVAYRAIVEGLSRDRTFGRSDLSVTGRGRSALLDAPYSATRTFGTSMDLTLQQLANDVLSFNGVPIGWNIDDGWKPDNWLIPAGVFSHQGTYASAINAIAASAGAYVQPHRTDKALSVLKRYPVKPWEWSGVTPDYELPADVVQKEGIVWTDKPVYNRVFLRGTGGDTIWQVSRDGTPGDVEAPMVVDQLMTHATGALQRAMPVLCDVGRQAIVSLRMPVLSETGVIPPGKFVRYVDGGVTRIGLTRSVTADVERSAEEGLKVWQTIGVETHVL